ncbi:hypothetical protein PR003_g3298 [Phytophthora rubi]|uniref:Uncharacterized protein n=1 Tax=Phytophthora rubi TaxID=129364 RepID=A0A6A4G1C2_9STRA|nr:hypothetical protein PR003_g3298 [Phytophthora rubi]
MGSEFLYSAIFRVHPRAFVHRDHDIFLDGVAALAIGLEHNGLPQALDASKTRPAFRKKCCVEEFGDDSVWVLQSVGIFGITFCGVSRGDEDLVRGATCLAVQIEL